MSTQSLEAYPSSGPSVAEGPRAFGILGWWLKAMDRIRSRIRQRRELKDLVALNDRLLADIGITREQAEAVRKAYWFQLFAAEASALAAKKPLQAAEVRP